MSSIYKNLSNEKQWKASTGLNETEFEKLLSYFNKLYFAKTGNPYVPDKNPVLTDKREALFFILHYLKAYPTLLNMSLYFGISEASVSEYITLLKPVLKATLLSSGTELYSEKDFSKIFEGVEDLFIDGFEIPIQRPVDEEKQKNHYSGKKNSTHQNG